MKKQDADSILAYQKDFTDFQDFQSTVFQQTQDNVRNTCSMLENFKANVQMFIPDGRRLLPLANKEAVTAPVLFTGDKVLLNKYFNELQLYYRVTYNHRGNLLNLKDYQLRLIEFFKHKYHYE